MKTTPLDFDGLVGLQVQVYRNLRNGKMSVQIEVERNKWRVVGHAENMALRDVTFPVNETKRQYILNVRKRRDVCAWARGVLVGQNFDSPVVTHVEVDFNPFLCGYFFEKESRTKLHPCQYLSVVNNRVYASRDALVQPGSDKAPLIALPDPMVLLYSLFSRIPVPA